jgi:choline-glycine betaine transporter
MKNKNNGLKMSCAICETVLAVPIIGGTIILGMFWIPLLLMLVLHIVTLSLTKDVRPVTGNIFGILGSVLGWIPVLGWLLHLLSAIYCWVEV